MFAPHCPHCRSRVLLGTRRIVQAQRSPRGGRSVVLRCHCGHLVVDDLGGTGELGAEPEVPAEGRPATVAPIAAEAPRPAPLPVGAAAASA